MVAQVEVVDLPGQATGLTLGAASAPRSARRAVKPLRSSPAAAVIGVRYALGLRSFG